MNEKRWQVTFVIGSGGYFPACLFSVYSVLYLYLVLKEAKLFFLKELYKFIHTGRRICLL